MSKCSIFLNIKQNIKLSVWYPDIQILVRISPIPKCTISYICVHKLLYLCVRTASGSLSLTLSLICLLSLSLSLLVAVLHRHRRMCRQKHDCMFSDLCQFCGELQVWVWERLLPGGGRQNMHQRGERWEFQLHSGDFSHHSGARPAEMKGWPHIVIWCVCEIERERAMGVMANIGSWKSLHIAAPCACQNSCVS